MEAGGRQAWPSRCRDTVGQGLGGVLVSTPQWSVQVQGGQRSPRAWPPILNPLSGWVPFSFPDGPSHSRMLYFLLCSCVMSRGLLDRGARNVHNAALCCFCRAVGSWAVCTEGQEPGTPRVALACRKQLGLGARPLRTGHMVPL